MEKNHCLSLVYFPCSTGIKIVGGYQEQSEEDYGIFIKKILPGGMAAVDSK